MSDPIAEVDTVPGHGVHSALRSDMSGRVARGRESATSRLPTPSPDRVFGIDFEIMMSPEVMLSRVAEDMHELSFTEGHSNYYSFAEGVAFATWLIENRWRIAPNFLTVRLYEVYMREVQSPPVDG